MGAEQGKMNKAELKALAEKSSFDGKQLKELLKLFQELDKDKSGELDRKEFTELFTKRFVMKGATPADVDTMFNAFDSDHSGTVSFTEMATALSVIGKGTKEEKLEYLFTMYDADKSNTLTHDETAVILERMSQVAVAMGRASPKTSDFINGIMSKLDHEKKGFITKADWITIGAKTPSLLLFLGIVDESTI
eukprot:TRINITY_DN16326_c0_g1_i1.p1 TRINITY_DN16326_c0_g1~~TRINITY_DN16326_c0_g1_i1.p1  ORF type:complete len:192 (-),score=58.37 TRINITY_DN16326_c0_g1_i1:434-1009(-)